MTTAQRTDIGFGKKLRLSWLDLALKLASEGATFAEAKPTLSEIVSRDNPGIDATRKSLVNLNRVWFNPPEYSRALRDDVLAWRRRSGEARSSLALHWSMSIAAYPFVGAVAEAIGRLARLQDVVSIREIKRRVGQRFGERDFVTRVVRYDMSSFLDWGVIEPAGEPGNYALGIQQPIADLFVVSRLIEAVLLMGDRGGISLAQARQLPHAFPFVIRDFLGGADIAEANPRLQVTRAGRSEDLITLERDV